MPDVCGAKRTAIRSGRWVAVVALGAIGLGAVLRAWGLDDRGLWLDEAFSALYSQLSLPDIIDLRRSGTNPPLYHVFLAVWVRGFGDSERAIRLPSVVFGVLAVAVMYPLAGRLAGRRTAALATLLLAINQSAVAFSQEARFYALLELWAMLTTWAVHEWVVDRRRRAGIAYLVLACVFVWLHTYAWLVLLAHGTWVLWRARRARSDPDECRRLWRGALMGLVLPVVVFLPWLPVLTAQVRRVASGYWITRPAGWEPLACLYDYLAPVASLAGAVAACAAVVGLYAIIGRSRTPPPPEAADPPAVPFGLLTTWLVIPVVIPFAWSLVATPVFQIKYTLVAQPAAVILFALLARRFTVVAMALLIAVSLWRPWCPEYPLQHEDWRAAATIIREHPPATAPVYVYRDYCWCALAYYLAAGDRIVPVTAPQQPPSEFLAHFPRDPVELQTLIDTLQTTTAPAWMVIARIRERQGPEGYDALIRRLHQARRIEECWRLDKIDLIRFGDRRHDE